MHNIKLKWITAVCTIAMLALSGVAQAKNDQQAKQESTASSKADLQIVITGNERTAIRSYYTEPQGKTKQLPKGLQKKLARGGKLPPGWQKKLARGEVVPSDVWSTHQPLPHDILMRLPPQPSGVITVRVDNQILRVIAATQVLLDVFEL